MLTRLCVRIKLSADLMAFDSHATEKVRLWKGKVLGTNHIAAFISRDFFSEMSFRTKFGKVRTPFGHFSELYPKCIPNASEMYQKSIPNSNKNTIFLQNKPTICPETNQISSIHCNK